MKSFVFKCLIFSVPMLIILWPLDQWLSENLKKSGKFVSGELPVWNDIYRGNINDELVIYGASRALYLNPEVLEDSLETSCYNLGINGLGFWHIYLRHRELLKYNKQPKCILLSIDDFSFIKGKNLFNSDQFLPYMLGNSNFRKYLRDVNDFTFFDYYIPFVRYFGRRNAIKEGIKCAISGNKSVPQRHKGYFVWDQEWTDEFTAVRDSLGSLEVANDASSIALFNDFLLECKGRNINVIFVNTPVYIEGQLFVSNREEVIRTYKEFSTQYNILFLDYSDDEMCCKKEYFYNAQHLNKMGAEIFNSRLASDLRYYGVMLNISLSAKHR